MAYAVEYFFITSLSFPFLGIYNAGAALFRVMGNSNISMVTSIVMNALNIIGNAVFVFGFDMKVIANSRHKRRGRSMTASSRSAWKKFSNGRM